MNYVNRRGDVYYVFQGATKTGKPRYYVSRKAKSDAGQQIDILPDDFELYEHPADARVSVRKKQLSNIHGVELEFLRERIETQAQHVHALVDVQGDSLVIYESESIGNVDSFAKVMGVSPSFAIRQIQAYSQMSAVFRFTLANKQTRSFVAERYCFRGNIDGWISLCDVGPLDELCRRYLKHIGKESFYALG